MSKPHRAYLIEPATKTVSMVQLDGSIEHMHELMKCDLFTMGARFHNGDTIYVDDEGLLKGEDQPIYLFRIDDRKVSVSRHTPLAGNALLAGCNERTGESMNPLMTLDRLKQIVVWFGPARVRIDYDGLQVIQHGAETEEVL